MSLVTVGRGAAIIAPISNDAFIFSVTINSYSEEEQRPVAIIHHRLAMVSVEASASRQYAAAKSDGAFCFFFPIAGSRLLAGDVSPCLPLPPISRFAWLCAMFRPFLRRLNFLMNMFDSWGILFAFVGRQLSGFRENRNGAHPSRCGLGRCALGRCGFTKCLGMICQRV